MVAFGVVNFLLFNVCLSAFGQPQLGFYGAIARIHNKFGVIRAILAFVNVNLSALLLLWLFLKTLVALQSVLYSSL